MDVTRFMACLTNMPRLRCLKVSEHGGRAQFTDDVWDFLTWTPDSSPLLTELESLDLAGGRDFSHKAIVRMLESRVPSRADFVSKLKTVDLSIWRKMSDSAYQRLIAFTKSGLDVHLDTMYEEEEESGSEASDAESEELDESDAEVE